MKISRATDNTFDKRAYNNTAQFYHSLTFFILLREFHINKN